MTQKICPYFDFCEMECIGNEGDYTFMCSILIEHAQRVKTRYKRVEDNGKIVILEARRGVEE